MRKQGVLLLALAAVLSLGFKALPWGPDVLVERGWIESFDADTSEDGTIYVATTVWGEHVRHEEIDLDEPITGNTSIRLRYSRDQGRNWYVAGTMFTWGIDPGFGNVRVVAGKQGDRDLVHVFHTFGRHLLVKNWLEGPAGWGEGGGTSTVGTITDQWEQALGAGTYHVARSYLPGAEPGEFSDNYVLVVAYHEHSTNQIRIHRSLDRGETWDEVARFASIPGWEFSWDFDLTFVPPGIFLLTYPKYLTEPDWEGEYAAYSPHWVEGFVWAGEEDWIGPWMIREEAMGGDYFPLFADYPRIGGAHSTWRDHTVAVLATPTFNPDTGQRKLEYWTFTEIGSPSDWGGETLAYWEGGTSYTCLDVLSPRKEADQDIHVLLSWEDEMYLCLADASGSPGVPLSYRERGMNDFDYYESDNWLLCPKLVHIDKPPVDCLGVVYVRRLDHANAEILGVDVCYDSNCSIDLQQMPPEVILQQRAIFEIQLEESEHPSTYSPGTGPLSVQLEASAIAVCETTHSHVLEISWAISGGATLQDVKIEITASDGSSYVHETQAGQGTGSFGLVFPAGGTVTVTATATSTSAMAVSSRSATLTSCE
ncbi:hypothetical protein KAU37_11570 [Candidatus Bipolaricaulota bacterium]|nr:hypothetical protein [Candidatus Bipolaricaulota bacterium]